jgi:hypothetical protein
LGGRSFFAATNHNPAESVDLGRPLSFPNIRIQKGSIGKEIKFNPQRAEAVSNGRSPVVVLSLAGSGKTMVLSEKVIHPIEEDFDPPRLLAPIEEVKGPI